MKPEYAANFKKLARTNFLGQFKRLYGLSISRDELFRMQGRVEGESDGTYQLRIALFKELLKVIDKSIDKEIDELIYLLGEMGK